MIIVSEIILTLYHGIIEIVPYSQRNWLIMLSKAMEKKLVERKFEYMKAEEKILSSVHPDNIKVRLIARNIIYTLPSDLYESKQLSWEIVVVNKPVLNALCLPGGKIIVFCGLLD